MKVLSAKRGYSRTCVCIFAPLATRFRHLVYACLPKPSPSLYPTPCLNSESEVPARIERTRTEMSEQNEQQERELARSACVWEATLEGAHYGMYGLAAGLLSVVAANNLSPGFRTLNTSARTALAISPAAFLFAFCGEEKLVECMREKTRQQYQRKEDS